MIKKLLLTLFLVLVQNVVSAQKTYSGASGNWNVVTNWTPNGVPTSTDDVIIPSGKTVNVDINAEAKSINISGTLTISSGKRLTVYGDFIVNTGGTFSMGSGNDSSTLIVYGNYTNNGTTNFYKSDVIIVGDLISPATSGLQNQGNVIVGGNIIGVFDLTGGTGTSQIYAVNPNAIVTITPISIDTNVIPGVQVTSESTALIALVNTVIYGGNCPFTITDIANISTCLGSNAVFTVTTNASSPSYLWQVNTNGSGWVDLTNDAPYSGVTTSTLTITGVVIGMNNYKYRAKIADGSPSCTKNGNYGVLTVNNPITTTWNGTAWSPSIPSTGNKIVFNGSFSSTADLEVCSCEVTAGNVVINNGHTLKVNNEVKVSGGSLKFENNASLVQTNDAALNSGNITYMRSNSTTRETDYTYWSSPVAGQILKNVSIKTPSNFFYSFNAVEDDWNQEGSANVMAIGLGYIIRGPHYEAIPPPGFYNAPFQGVANNGPVYVAIPSLGRETSNLIGNPYPSALNADLFLTTNSPVLEGTLYFWTHNTSIQLASNITNGSAGSGVYAYTSDDYATYNLTGGTATSIGNVVGGVEQTSNKPNGKIAAGQAFFATGKVTGGALVFNNSMRVSGGALGINNSQFFRTTKSSKTTNSVEKHRIWLNLTNSEGAFKQMLVGYVTDATNDYDDAFDGESFDGNEFIDFYSINEDKNLTIQGRALPFDKNDEVTLGYSSTIEGTFSISIDQVDGVLASEDVFIEDKMTNSVKNLKEGAYSFTTQAGVFNDRFVLRYIDKTLDTGDFETADDKVVISVKNKQIKIDSPKETIDKVLIFDLLGKQIYKKISVGNNEHIIPNLVLIEQVLIVKVVLQNGQTVSRKIIY